MLDWRLSQTGIAYLVGTVRGNSKKVAALGWGGRRFGQFLSPALVAVQIAIKHLQQALLITHEHIAAGRTQLLFNLGNM